MAKKKDAQAVEAHEDECNHVPQTPPPKELPGEPVKSVAIGSNSD